MAASGTRPSRPKPRFSWRRLWRIILAVLKGLLLFTLALVTIELLASGPAGRISAIFVIVLACLSLAYLFFVSSRVRLNVPGVDLDHVEPERDITHREDASDPRLNNLKMRALKRTQESAQDVMPTIQVSRLSSDAVTVTVVNDAPLPVLRAETSFEIERATEGKEAFAGKPAEQTKRTQISLPAHSAKAATLAHVFNHVGIYRMRSAGVRVFGLLGAFSRRRGTPGSWRVRVVPNVYRLTRGIPLDRRVLPTDLGIPDITADALDYDRVRDYEPGDPLKIIHWKISAHCNGELYTKLFETATISVATLVIDPYGLDGNEGSLEAAYHRYDTLLEGGFSLIEHARQSGMSTLLRFVNHEGTQVEVTWPGLGALGWFVETAQQPAQSRVAQQLSVQIIQNLQGGRGGYVVFATGRLTDQSVEALIACHEAGVPLVVLHALPLLGQADGKQQRAYDVRLREASIGVVAITDGPRIVKEVVAS